MSDTKKVCKWITDKVEEGRGAVTFCLEENDGMIGVWIGEPVEHERALGYGNDAFEAVLDAIRREATEHTLARGQGGTLPKIIYLDPNTQTHSENGAVYFRPAGKA